MRDGEEQKVGWLTEATRRLQSEFPSPGRLRNAQLIKVQQVLYQIRGRNRASPKAAIQTVT